MMSRVTKGMIAGFAAACVVAALEVANMMLGPWATPFPRILAVGLESLGLPFNLALGWTAHFLMGTVVLGGLFGVLCPRLPTDTPESKGILFAVGAFVLMGIFVAPLANVGMFGARAGFGTMAWLIATHAVFGIVLGGVYSRLVEREKRMARQAPVGGAPA